MAGGRQVERRSQERNEAETWSEDERKALTKLGKLFDKWNNRQGKKTPEREKSFLEELGIRL